MFFIVGFQQGEFSSVGNSLNRAEQYARQNFKIKNLWFSDDRLIKTLMSSSTYHDHNVNSKTEIRNKSITTKIETVCILKLQLWYKWECQLILSLLSWILVPFIICHLVPLFFKSFIQDRKQRRILLNIDVFCMSTK